MLYSVQLETYRLIFEIIAALKCAVLTYDAYTELKLMLANYSWFNVPYAIFYIVIIFFII